MGFVVGIIVLAIFIWLMVAFPAFRVFVLVVFGLIVGGTWWVMSNYSKNQRLELQLITQSEVQFKDIRISHGYGGSYQIIGVVKNLSTKHTLSSIGFAVTAYDCPTDEVNDGCETIGEDDAYVSVNAPPGQMRSFEGSLYFTNMPRPKNLQLRYDVAWIKGKR